MTGPIFFAIVVGFGVICGILSREWIVGLGASVLALVVVGLGWGIHEESKERAVCYDACLAADAPMAQSAGGCWCYRGASETFRIEVPE